jgi:DNA-binding XRE family transcriptional regulator/predicted GIY-YIG superfamily endonuclease
MTMTERTALYRVFGTEDELLYAGISNSFGRRWEQHARTKEWWQQARRQAVEWFDTRAEALSAEAAAIKAEHPRYNIVYNDLPRRVTIAPSAPEPVLAEDDVYLISELRKGCISGEARDLRELARIRQVELAEVLGVTRVAVCQWESGQRFPSTAVALEYGGILADLAEIVLKNHAVRPLPSGDHALAYGKLLRQLARKAA